MTYTLSFVWKTNSTRIFHLYWLSGALGMTHCFKIMSLALVHAKKLIIEGSATAYTMYIDKQYAHTLL